MADQQHLPAQPHMPHRLLMNLGYQRACGIQIQHLTALGFRRNGFRHTMGREDDRLPVVGNGVQFLDEDGPHAAQPFDHVFVVHDLVPHIDRCAVLLQRQHHDLDGTVHARAETARLAQADGQGRLQGRFHSRYVLALTRKVVPQGTKESHRPCQGDG